ncbi:hypothetical protein IAD21_04781 [Abditibacteriota bacterium]|nr:hypothetical protein IAD21_04781 [Abditibacteriota bacterium]
MKRSTFVLLSLVAVPVVALPVLTQAKPKASKMAVVPAIPKGIGGVWNLDPMHSRIGFVVRHVMINDIHGSFNDFSGTVKVDEKDFSRSQVEFSAKIASIDTNVEARDNHLKSPDFFDAAKYPEMTFKSKHVARNGAGFRVMGAFTMHGVTRDIVIPFIAAGPVKDGFGFIRSSVKANFDINRQDYSVKWNQKLDNGGMALSDIVHVELDLEATKAGSGPKKPA